MTRPTLLVGLFALTAAAACLSGQTGSPDCPGPQSCVCDPLYAGGVLLRVRGEAPNEPGRLSALVEEAFESPYGFTGVGAGERVGGALLQGKPCALEALGELAGAELLVLYNPGSAGGYPNCDDFHACASAQCGRLSEPELTECWQSCSLETEQTCGQLREAALLDGVFHWAVPWSEQLDFGGEHQLPRSDVAVLSEPDSCLERFPPAPVPACRDTVSLGPCSLSSSRPALPRGGNAAAALGFLALLLGARRRGRR